MNFTANKARKGLMMSNKKPYYDLTGALYMAKNHGLQFIYDIKNHELWKNEPILKFDGILSLIAHNIYYGAIWCDKFFVANPEVLEPIGGDTNRWGDYFDGDRKGWLVWHSDTKGELLDPKDREIDFRKGIAFLQPQYEEVEND